MEQAHKHGLKVVAHAHRPDEIRRGLLIGVDNFEHTGLTPAPGFPEDVLRYINKLSDVTLVMKGGVIYKQNGKVVESAL